MEEQYFDDWIILKDEYGKNLQCSNCGSEFMFECLIETIIWEDKKISYIGGNFCPDCGARMRR